MGILTPKNLPFDDYFDRGQYLMTWRVTFFLTIATASMTVAYYNVEFYAFVTYLTGFGITLSGLLYLYFTKCYKHVLLFYAIAGTALAHFSTNLSLSTPHYVDFLWIVVCSFLAFMAMGNRIGLAFMILNVLGVGFFIFFRSNKHIEAIKPLSLQELTWVYIELFIALAILSYLVYQFVKFQDYSKTKIEKANTELEKQYAVVQKKNEENQTLLKEIHHRVKNNLQIIISLLRLQQSEMKSSESQLHFTEAINRVMVMSSIHQKLYQQEDLTDIDLENYVTELAVELKQLYMNELNVVIDVDCDYYRIDLKTIVPVGLLLNELLSNSFKYAFEHQESGDIKIDIKDKGDTFELRYADSGDWKVDEEKSGFGLELIQILTEQLNGKRDLETDKEGTIYNFTLQKLNT